MAIRCAEQKGDSALVITDSQSTCRMFQAGAIPRTAIRILGEQLLNSHAILWCPAHAGLEGNERADRLARELSIRAPVATLEEPPTTPRDILENQRGERQKYSYPHPDLTGEQARDWRRVQTNTYPHLQRQHHIHPTMYARSCPWCGERPTLAHITWECQSRPPNVNSPLLGTQSQSRQWESWLASKDRESQLALLDQAQRAAKASGALD